MPRACRPAPPPHRPRSARPPDRWPPPMAPRPERPRRPAGLGLGASGASDPPPWAACSQDLGAAGRPPPASRPIVPERIGKRGRPADGAGLGGRGCASAAVPATVDDEVDAIHRAVLEQEPRCIDHVREGGETAERRLGGVVGDRRRLRRPVRAVPDIPGRNEFTRIGFSSSTIDRVNPTTPPFTVLTVVDPGYGRSLAMPPKTTMDEPSSKRGSSVWTTSVKPTSLSVASRIARSML